MAAKQQQSTGKPGKPQQKGGGGGLVKQQQPAGKKRPASGGGPEFKQQNKKHKSSGLPPKSVKPAATAAPTEKPAQSKHDKKEKIRQKKSALKKNFGIIQDAVPIWEVLRQHQTPADEKARLVDQVLQKVKGKLLELARHHTASRILQFCVMYGTDAQKRLLMDQVKADFLTLSKSKHGRHLVQKLISQAKKEEVPSLVGLCKGHVKELLRHPSGADVMIDLYDVANTQLRNAMCAEFYGREFSLFDGIGAKGSSLSSLAQLLEGSDNAKRRSVLLHMTKALMPIVEKGILHPPMVHRLLKDFFDCAPSASVEDVIDTLSASGTTVLKMVHTHEGAAVGCMLLAYGSAKDRKRLIKAMKGHVTTMATNEWGYTVLCTALRVVDDTSLVSKVIVTELKTMLEEAVEDPHASRVLLQLLCPNSRRYLPPAVLEMLHPPQRTVVGTSGNMVTDIEGDEDELAGGVGEAHGFGVTADDEDGGDGDDFLQLKAPASKADKSKGDGKRDSKKGKEGEEGGQRGAGSAGKADEEGEQDEGADQKGTLTPGGKRILGLSKKDESLRRKELLGPANSSNSFAAALTSTCAERAGALLRTAHAADVVVEVARGGAQGLVAELAPEGVAAVHAAIVAEVSSSSTAENGSGKQSQTDSGEEGQEEEEDGDQGSQGVAGPQGEHVCTHYYASRALRRLLLAGSEAGSGGECARQLARALWQGALQGQCHRWVGTHAEKVLAALLHCGCEDVAKQAASELAHALHEDPVAWSERLVHTALLKDKQEGGKVATKGKGKGKQHQQQQQNLQGKTRQQQQQQQQQESPVGSSEVGKKRNRHESASAPGQGRVAEGNVGGSAAKSTVKKKKKHSDGQNS